jgi:hypothetical protein
MEANLDNSGFSGLATDATNAPVSNCSLAIFRGGVHT